MTRGALVGSRDALVAELETRAHTVPTDTVEADGTFAWDSTTMVVVRARAADVTGTGWTYAPRAAATLVQDLLADVVVGADALDVPAAQEAMVRAVRNVGRPGVAGTAISAVDTALWDLKARLLLVPLASLFGASRDRVPVYGSGGFTTYDDRRLEEQVRGWQEHGITMAKIKIGEDRGTRVARDLHRVARARELLGDAALFVDANGAYAAKQAIRIGTHLEEHGVTWFEEPVSSDDLAGLARVRDGVSADVTAGEYGYDPAYFARMAEVVDCLQVDVTRCGGYTGWLRVAAVAAAHGLDVSAHGAPALTAPVAAATPHCRHLEWFHDHVRIEERLCGAEPPRDGALVLRDGVGHGHVLDETAAEPYRVS